MCFFLLLELYEIEPNEKSLIGLRRPSAVSQNHLYIQYIIFFSLTWQKHVLMNIRWKIKFFCVMNADSIIRKKVTSISGHDYKSYLFAQSVVKKEIATIFNFLRDAVGEFFLSLFIYLHKKLKSR